MKAVDYQIVTLPSYRAVGLKWEGPYTKIGELKQVINTVKSRVKELDYALNPDVQFGLSYHTRPDGFVHYSVYEVGEEQVVPNDMIEMKIPEMTYLKTKHEKGENVGQTYMDILEWMKDNNYSPFKESEVDYFDQLPIKHERYPRNQDATDPHFDIYIPLQY